MLTKPHEEHQDRPTDINHDPGSSATGGKEPYQKEECLED
jgi:hypothetical protein